MTDKKQHETPMLDELENGPWPSFISGIKRLRDEHPEARINGVANDLLGSLSTLTRPAKATGKAARSAFMVTVAALFRASRRLVSSFQNQKSFIRCACNLPRAITIAPTFFDNLLTAGRSGGLVWLRSMARRVTSCLSVLRQIIRNIFSMRSTIMGLISVVQDLVFEPRCLVLGLHDVSSPARMNTRFIERSLIILRMMCIDLRFPINLNSRFRVVPTTA